MTERKTADKLRTAIGELLPKLHSYLRGLTIKNRVLIAIGIAVLVILIFGLPHLLYALSHETTDDAFIDGHVVPVGSRVAGHVARVYVDDNQWVDAGDLLLELDAGDFEARLEESKSALQSRQISVGLMEISSSSDLDEARANVDAARAGVESAQAKVAAAVSGREQAAAQLASVRAALAQVRAEVDSAQAQHERDAADLRRYRDLAARSIVSQQQLDHAAAAAQMSAANLEAIRRKAETQEMSVAQVEAALKAAEDSVRQAEAGVVFSKGQLAQAQARFAAAQTAPQRVALSRAQADEAEAEVHQAQLNLSYTRIVAPSSGYVTKKSAEPGSYVQVGQPLMAIVSPDVWVVGNFKETQLTDIRAGQPVDVAVDTYPGVIFKGRVDSIQHGSGARFSLLPPENATGNFIKVVQRVPVKIVFDDRTQLEDYILSPGMSAVPSIDTSAKVSSKTAQLQTPSTSGGGKISDVSSNQAIGGSSPDASQSYPD